jgi:sodium/proline symporter
VIEDIYHKTLNKKVSEQLLLRLSRGITIIVGVLGFLIAISSGKLIFSMVSYAWAGLGASFGPALFLTLKWKKTTWQGILAGMVVGTLSTVIWSEIEWLDSVISARLSSFVLAFATVYLTSMSTFSHKPAIENDEV